jgi:hypothetical protein
MEQALLELACHQLLDDPQHLDARGSRGDVSTTLEALYVRLARARAALVEVIPLEDGHDDIARVVRQHLLEREAHHDLPILILLLG